MKEVSISSFLILYIKDVLQIRKSSPDFFIGKNNTQLQNDPPTRKKKSLLRVQSYKCTVDQYGLKSKSGILFFLLPLVAIFTYEKFLQVVVLGSTETTLSFQSNYLFCHCKTFRKRYVPLEQKMYAILTKKTCGSDLNPWKTNIKKKKTHNVHLYHLTKLSQLTKLYAETANLHTNLLS